MSASPVAPGRATVRWVGIDEAGYGPNLGPLVMSAVVAEGPADRPLDLWADLAGSVSRAGVRDGRLWVDDSKQVTKAKNGRDRLDAATLAALAAAGQGTPRTLGAVLAAVGAGSLATAELADWLDGFDPPFPRPGQGGATPNGPNPLEGAPWRIVAVRSRVVGPERFNEGLDRLGSKALVHFETFRSLLGDVWGEGQTFLRADKHGGRHFYADLFRAAFPEATVTPGPEGPELSAYDLMEPGRALRVELVPRADSGDGLVALASLVSKAIREHAMDSWNRFWLARMPDLKPTAGYPVDALRFRTRIEPVCEALGLPAATWWRAR